MGGYFELKLSVVCYSFGYDLGYFLVFLWWFLVMLIFVFKRYNFLFVKIYFLNGFSF